MAFEKFIRRIIAECSSEISAKYSAVIPNYRFILCNNQSFEQLLADEPNYGKRPTSFTDRLKRIIAVNVDALLTVTWGTFTINLVMNIMEELLHSAFPLKPEREIKGMTYGISEEYLEMKIPADYKKKSMGNAESPDY